MRKITPEQIEQNCIDAYNEIVKILVKRKISGFLSFAILESIKLDISKNFIKSDGKIVADSGAKK